MKESVEGLSSPIIVSFKLTTEDVSRLQKPWQILLHLNGDFSIYVDGQEWYREFEFCLVEFARDVFAWLQSVQHEWVPLEYESLESEERPFIWIRPVDSQWVLRAAFEKYPLARKFDFAEMKEPFEVFVETLQREISNRFGSAFGLKVSNIITGQTSIE